MSVRFLVNVSDIHLGCQLALCPREGVALDNGGIYKPSTFQLRLANFWDCFFKEFVPRVTKREKWALVINGDAVEGEHHNSWTPISANPEVQARCALDVLEPVVKLAKGGLYMIRGTPAHVGQDANSEESLARVLGAIKPTSERHTWDHLKLRFGYDSLADIKHHISGTGNGRTTVNASGAEYHDQAYESGRIGEEWPDVVCRAHCHNANISGIPAKADGTGRTKLCWSLTTPCWQLKNGFGHKVSVARNKKPEFGGWVLESTPDGVVPHLCLWKVKDTEETHA